MMRSIIFFSLIVLSCAQALQEPPRPKPPAIPSGVTINDASRAKLGLNELQPAEVIASSAIAEQQTM